MHRNKSVSSHQFAMVPKAEIPRSSFDTQYAHKTTFDGGYLVPIYCDEVLPGDMHTLRQQCLLVWQRHCFLLWIICILIRFSFSFLTVWFGRIGLNLWVSRRTPVILQVM